MEIGFKYSLYTQPLFLRRPLELADSMGNRRLSKFGNFKVVAYFLSTSLHYKVLIYQKLSKHHGKKQVKSLKPNSLHSLVKKSHSSPCGKNSAIYMCETGQL